MRSSSLSLLGSALLIGQGLCNDSYDITFTDIPALQEDTPIVPNDLQAFSIEFSYFPDYAGNKSQPNEFSKNLLANFETLTGRPPVVRVGGTSQDNSYWKPNQTENIQLIYANPNDDQPETIYYGPTFFESYETLGNVRFFHGLNMKQNDSYKSVEDSAVAACTRLGSQLELFELGNEWNMEASAYRGANYTIQDYVYEWNNKTAAIKSAVEKACPQQPFPGFFGPSWIILPQILSNFTWTAEQAVSLGFDSGKVAKQLCFHNYMGVNYPGANPPLGWDLQTRLMNHTNIQESLSYHVQRAKDLAHLGLPYVIGELNSIANQGITGETDVLGDALWLVDFSLWAGANGINRLHFHQGENYRYASWQPLLGKGQPPTTRAPYYGQITVASALGRSENSRIVNIPLNQTTESAYAIYDGDLLSKIVVVNMQAFNQTTSGIRPTKSYFFKVPSNHQHAKVERLEGAGSDATQKITFGGISYDHDLAMGQPVVVDSREELAPVVDGVIRVVVSDSSAAVVTLQ